MATRVHGMGTRAKMAAMDLSGFPEYLECIKHVIRQGGLCPAELDQNRNWTPEAKDPLLRRALTRMVTKDKILVPIGGPGSKYKLLPTFEKLDAFFWFGSQWSSISTPDLTVFLDNNVASIGHKQLIWLLKHKVMPQIPHAPDPLADEERRGTKRRRSSSDASESSHASDLSSLILLPTPSPPSSMRSTVSPIRKVRKSASASTPLLPQASGLLAFSSQEQLEKRLSEMPWIRSGFEGFHEKYPNDEFELVLDDGALKMKCHDCSKNLIKAEYPFSRGLSNVEAHFKNLTHRNAVKNRIHAKKPPRSSSQSVPTASMKRNEIAYLSIGDISSPSPIAASLTSATVNLSPVATNRVPDVRQDWEQAVLIPSSQLVLKMRVMGGKERICLPNQHRSSPSPVVENPRLSPSSPNSTPTARSHTPTTVNPTLPTHDSGPNAASHTSAIVNPNPSRGSSQSVQTASMKGKEKTHLLSQHMSSANPTLGPSTLDYTPAASNPNPTLAVANPANPVSAVSEPSKSHFPVIPGAELNNSSKLGADSVREDDAAETSFQLDDHEKQWLKDLVAEDRTYIGDALLDTESKLIVQRESINALEEKAKTQTSSMQEMKAELFSKVTKQQESIAIFEERANIQTSLIRELKKELCSKVAQDQEIIATLKETMKSQTNLIQELKRNLLLKEELSLKVSKQQESLEVLEESSRSQTSVIQELQEELSSSRKRGQVYRERTTDELESLKETATTQTSLIEEVRHEFSLLIANEKDSRQSADLNLKETTEKALQEVKEEFSLAMKREKDSRQHFITGVKGVLESRITVQQERVDALKTTATEQKEMIQEVRELAAKRVNECQKKIDARIGTLVEASNSEKKMLQGLKEDVLLATKRAEEYRQENDHRIKALVAASYVDERYNQELKEELSSALKRVEEVRQLIEARVGGLDLLVSRDEDLARQRAEKKQKVRDLREDILQAKKRAEDLRAKKSKRLDAVMKPMGEKEDRAVLNAEIRVLIEHEQQERAYVSNLETHLLELFCED